MREINTDIKVDKNVKGPLKRAALFHDLSGFGKCSITTGLPILAAAGIEGACVPTAVLSTHTGGFEGYTFRDLTEDLPAFIKHWNDLGIHFDAIYSGYLGSPEQARILLDFIKFQRERNPELITIIDPVMGDRGILYSGFGERMVEAMRSLLPVSDVLLPNMTEALALLGKPYKPGPYSEGEILEVCRDLTRLGPKTIVLTGLETAGGKITTAVYGEGVFETIQAPLVGGEFHGTGDVFASFFTGAYLNGLPLVDCALMAAELTYGAALRTSLRETPRRDGVDFEEMLPAYMQRLESLKGGDSE